MDVVLVINQLLGGVWDIILYYLAIKQNFLSLLVLKVFPHFSQIIV
jgi:hypothetical protein